MGTLVVALPVQWMTWSLVHPVWQADAEAGRWGQVGKQVRRVWKVFPVHPACVAPVLTMGHETVADWRTFVGSGTKKNIKEDCLLKIVVILIYF